MAETKGERMIRSYFEAYRTRDRAMLEDLLAPGFTFTSPRDDAIDRDTYFGWCWKNSGDVIGHDLERIVEIGRGEFLVVYLCSVLGGRQFRNAEIFKVEGEKICEVEVYFGPGFKDGAFVVSA